MCLWLVYEMTLPGGTRHSGLATKSRAYGWRPILNKQHHIPARTTSFAAQIDPSMQRSANVAVAREQ